MKRRSVTPVYRAGGKHTQLDSIRKALPVNFKSIIEPFAGSAALSMALLADGGRDIENVWLNDCDIGLMAFWKTLRDERVKLLNDIMAFRYEHGLGSKELYQQALAVLNDEQASDYKRGLMFYVHNRLAVTMRVGQNNYAHPLASKKGLRLDYFEWLPDFGRLLNGAKITCGDYRNVQGEDGALMFCDPPYDMGDKKIASMYGAAFNQADFVEWCESVRDVCQMMITLDDNPKHIERFAGWNIYRHSVYYPSRKERDTELFITNYAVPFASVWVKESGWKIIQETIESPTAAANDITQADIAA